MGELGLMAQLMHPDIAGSFMRGQAFGTQQRLQREADERRSGLAALMSQAYSTPKEGRSGLLSQIAGIDPNAAMRQSEAFESDDDRRNTEMVRMARMLVSAPKELKAGLYAGMVPTLKSFGMQQLPEVYDDSTAGIIDQTAQSLVQAWSGADGVPAQQQYVQWLTSQLPESERMDSMRYFAGVGSRPLQNSYTYDVVETDQGPVIQRRGRLGDVDSVGAPGTAPQGQPRRVIGTEGMMIDGQAVSPAEARAFQTALQAAERGEDFNVQVPHSGAPSVTLSGGGSPRMLSAAEQAGASEAAKQQAQIDSLPERQRIETQGEIDRMRAESGIKPTKAQEAVDTQYGKDYVEFISGGAADANKALDELSGVIKQLERGDNLTGPVLGATPKFMKERLAPEAQAAQETVESTVQRSLRAILGAQFTEGEGNRLIARAYNPSLPESENLVRVKRLFKQLQEGFENKAAAARFYEENGTLRGFNGKLPSWGDFDLEGDSPPAPRNDARRQSLLDRY